jgi:hypothetical protein
MANEDALTSFDLTVGVAGLKVRLNNLVVVQLFITAAYACLAEIKKKKWWADRGVLGAMNGYPY